MCAWLVLLIGIYLQFPNIYILHNKIINSDKYRKPKLTNLYDVSSIQNKTTTKDNAEYSVYRRVKMICTVDGKYSSSASTSLYYTYTILYILYYTLFKYAGKNGITI